MMFVRKKLPQHPQVCTLRPGRTEVTQHHIYTTHQVPIKQRPYRTTPAKQAVISEQLEEMLTASVTGQICASTCYIYFHVWPL